MLLERIFPYKEGVSIFRKGFWLDLIWYTLIQSYLLKILIFDLIILPLKNFSGISAAGYISHWPIPVLVLFFLVSHDFYIYWFHRWQHSNRYLWKTHEAHHSVRNVDWLAGSRSHPLEILINQTIEFLPIFFLLDARTAAIVVPLKALLDALWGTWIHSNINFRLGNLIYIVNGPEMHQWHHANHKEVFYSNYATKFSFFDWVFGTAFLPGKNPLRRNILKPIGYGLPYPFPDTYIGQLIYSIFRFDINLMNKLKFTSLLPIIIRIKLNCKVPSRIKCFWQKLFGDQGDEQYQLDRQPPLCPACTAPMKYYYENNSLHLHCSSCNSKYATETDKIRIN